MARKHPRSYPTEFRLNVIDFARAGRGADELAIEFKISPQTIRNWIKQADLDRGRRTDGLTSAEPDELATLRKENKQLKVEREILGKAAADSTHQRNTSFSLRADGFDSTEEFRIREGRIRPFGRYERNVVCWASRPAASMRGINGSRRREHR